MWEEFLEKYSLSVLLEKIGYTKNPTKFLVETDDPRKYTAKFHLKFGTVVEVNNLSHEEARACYEFFKNNKFKTISFENSASGLMQVIFKKDVAVLDIRLNET